MNIENIRIRTKVIEEDLNNVREILESSKFFYEFEIDVAVELVQEYLDYGAESGYLFLFVEVDGRTLGYACFGHISVTKRSYDLYWIGVHEDCRGLGLGKILMKETEKIVKDLGGKSIYIETSSRDKYIPTQKFYISYGCDLIARITDFYDDGDDKLLYRKDV
jgi:ribosomal protein S18 acetylase RimI-like enzyme